MTSNPAYARFHKNNPVLHRFFLRLNTACRDQRSAAIPAPRRYATVSIYPLNGGAGAVHKNFETQEEFEMAFRSQFPTMRQIPDRGVGGIGNGIFNWSWKIFA